MIELNQTCLRHLHHSIVNRVWRSDSTAIPCIYSVAGSHLYGTTGPNSDIDIRGFHCVPAKDYLRIDSPEQRLDLNWEEKFCNSLSIEVTSYELRAFGRQLSSQNINLIEAVICGQVVNQYTPNHLHNIREILINKLGEYLPKKYTGMAQGLIPPIEQGSISDEITVNELLYAFRGVLAALYFQQKERLEVDLTTLSDIVLTEDQRRIIKELINKKHNQGDVVIESSKAIQAVSIIESYVQDMELDNSDSNREIRNAINGWMMQVRNDTGTLASSNNHINS